MPASWLIVCASLLFSTMGVCVKLASAEYASGEIVFHRAALLLAVGVLATVAQLMMTRAYSTGQTLVNASPQYLGIAWSFAYGVLLFEDRSTAMAVAGMLLIAAAGLSASLLHHRGSSDIDIGDAPHTV
jgi:drug/metabolite transporter (DMT)-like permease